MKRYIPRRLISIRRNICNNCDNRKKDTDTCRRFDCDTNIGKIIKYFSCPENKW